MKYFKRISNLDTYDLFEDYQFLIEDGEIEHKAQYGNEICLTCTDRNSMMWWEGAGSLVNDWTRAYTAIVDGVRQTMLPKVPESEQKREEDFSFLCNVFVGTEFERLYHDLCDEGIEFGRIKLFLSHPKTCLSMHVDQSPRLHYPIFTTNDSHMVIDNEVLHMPKDQWFWTDTTVKHTSFNGSHRDRLHLVVSNLSDNGLVLEDFDWIEPPHTVVGMSAPPVKA